MLRVFLRNPVTQFCLVVILLTVFAGVFAPLLGSVWACACASVASEGNAAPTAIVAPVFSKSRRPMSAMRLSSVASGVKSVWFVMCVVQSKMPQPGGDDCFHVCSAIAGVLAD